MQWRAREAAIAMGEGRYDDAIKELEILQGELAQGDAYWEERAGEFRLDEKGELMEYPYKETPETLAERPPPTKPGDILEPGQPAVPILNQNQIKRIERIEIMIEKMKKIGDLPEVRKMAYEVIRAWTAQIELGLFEVNKLRNDIELQTTPEDRIMLHFIMAAEVIPPELESKVDEITGITDFAVKLEANRERLTPLAKQLSATYKKWFRYQIENLPKMSAHEVENYVTRFWNLPPQSQHFGQKEKGRSEISNWFITRSPFFKQRTLGSLVEGIAKGYTPKTLDIAEIMQIYGHTMVRVVANNQLVDVFKKLKVNGVPLIEKASIAPVEWKYMDIPALNKIIVIPKVQEQIDKVSDKMTIILNELGLAIGRRLAPMVFGKPSGLAGVYRPGKVPPEIAFRKFFSSRTLAHEIGHFLHLRLGVINDAFVNKYKSEIYKLNLARIKRHENIPGKYGKAYAESVEEQIAELFAFIFADIKTALKLAPNATNEALDILKKDGVLRKLVDLDFEKEAKIRLERNINLMREVAVRVHPDLEYPLHVIFDQRVKLPVGWKWGDKFYTFDLARNYEFINGIFKKTQLSISLFHHIALGETSVATIGPGKTMKIAFNWKKIYAALARGEFDAFKNSELSREAIEDGVQIGATADIPVKRIQQALDDFAKKTGDKKLIGAVANFAAGFNKKWDLALWNYYHDSLKLFAYEHLRMQLYKDYPNLKEAEYKKYREEIAEWVNDSFGGQNWANNMVSTPMLQVASWAFLSPDWTYSTINQGMGLMGVGAIHDEFSGMGGFRQDLAKRFWLHAALYFGIGINLLNVVNRMADRKKFPEKYKDMSFADMMLSGNSIGHKTHLFMGRWDDGTERYLRWGKQFREIPEMLFDEMSFNPIAGSLRKLGAKAAPMPQLLSVWTTGSTLSGFTIRSVKEAEGWEKTWELLKYTLKTPLPLATRNLIEEGKEFGITDLAMPSSKGMTRATAIRLYKIGIKRGDPNVMWDVAKACNMNNLPALELMKAASTAVKAETTKELTRSLRTIEQVDEALEKTTDPETMDRLYRKKDMLMSGINESKVLEQNMEVVGDAINGIMKEHGLE
jgi:hypothetical protein